MKRIVWYIDYIRKVAGAKLIYNKDSIQNSILFSAIAKLRNESRNQYRHFSLQENGSIISLSIWAMIL